MDAALLLVPVISGYIFNRLWIVTNFATALDEGQRLHFRAVAYGAWIFTITGELAAIMRWRYDVPFGQHAEFFWQSVHYSPALGPGLASLCLLTLPCAAVLALILNAPLAWEGSGLRVKLLRRIVRDDDLEQVLLESLLSASLLVITLSTRKAYVGFVNRAPIPNRKWVSLYPVVGGYRDKDTLDLEITSNYIIALDEIEAKIKKGEIAEQEVANLEIVVPLHQVVSISPFDFKVFEHLQDIDVSDLPPAEVVEGPPAEGPENG